MRVIARFMDARNTAEGKFLSVLLSVLLVFSFLNVTMFTDLANADDEVALGAATEIVDEVEDDGEVVEEEPEVTEPEAPTSETKEEAPAEEPTEDPVKNEGATEPITNDSQATPDDETNDGFEAAPVTRTAAPTPNKGTETYASDPVAVSVGDTWTVTCDQGRSHNHSWKTSDSSVVKITKDAKKKTVSLEAVGSGAATVSCGDTTYVYQVEETLEEGQYPVYIYTLLPGITSAGDGAANSYWNGMGVGTVSGNIPHPNDAKDSNYLSQATISFPEDFPNIVADGVSYRYTPSDSPNSKVKGYYTIEWTQLIVSNGANAGNNGYNPVVESGKTYHLDGQVFINKENSWNVAFEVWNPQADGYQLLTDFSVIVPDGTSEGTIKKPNMENKVVDGVTYAFDGWYEDAERTVKANFDGQVHQRTFYYGKYVPVDVTLSYDLDGGTPSIEGEVTPKTVTAGESVTLASAPSKKGFRFLGWAAEGQTYAAEASYGMPSHDVTMVAQWAALHSVIYNWTGLPTTQLYDENGEEVAIPVLPTDENVYAAGDTYTVDDTYVANTVYYTHDEFGNKNASYTFTGWDKTGVQAMGDADVTLKGSWVSESIEVPLWTIAYVWKDGKAPAGVQLPVDSKQYKNNENYVVAPEFVPVNTTDEYGNVTGVWTFEGWNAGDGSITENLTIEGEWKYEETTVARYGVTYKWNGLPASSVLYDEQGNMVTPQLPVDADTYVKGQPYQLKDADVKVLYTKDAYGNNTAKYTLGAWNDPNNGTMAEGGTKVTAQWSAMGMVVPQRLLTYEWENAPEQGTVGVKDADAVTLPAAQQYVNGAGYQVDSTYSKDYTVNTYDQYGNVSGQYVFSGWTIEGSPETITKNLVAKGTWTYEETTVAKHNVTYAWTGLPEGETLYDAAGNPVVPMRPLNLPGLVKGQGYTVDSALPGTTVYTHDAYGNQNASYTLGAWNDPNSGVMGEDDVEITAQWTKADIEVPTVEVRYAYKNGLMGIPNNVPPVPVAKDYFLNQPIDAVDVPTREGWTFSGWSIDANRGYAITEDDIAKGIVEITGTWDPDTEMLAAEGYRGVYDGDVHRAAVTGTMDKDQVFFKVNGLLSTNNFVNVNVSSANPQSAIVEAIVMRDGIKIWSEQVPMVITKRPVKIEGQGWDEPQPYTGEEYAANGYTAEQRNGDRGLVSHAKVSGLTYDLAGTAAGSYTGSFGGQVLIKLGTGENVTGNYEVELVHGGLTIEAKNLTDPDVNPEEPTEAAFTVQYESTKVYNGTEQKPEASDILVTDRETGFQLVPGVDYGVYYRPANGVATTPADFVNAGETTIVVYGMGNYQGQFELPYEIIPAPLTVSAAYASKVFGEDDPEFTWTVEGLFSQNGVLDAMGAVTVSRSTGEENAGLYEDELVPAVAEGDRNSNYTYEFVPADFRILQDDENDVVIDGINDVASQSIVKTYDGEVVAIEAAAARPEGSTLEYSVDGGEWGAEVPTFLNAGVYEVAVRATNPNYETVEKTVTVVINRAPVTVTAVASGKYFGTADPSLTATVTGLVAGESESLIDYVVAREAGEAVGEYSIIPAGLATQGNYAVSYEAAPFTISLAPVVPPTVTPNPVNPPTVTTTPTAPTAPAPAAPTVTPAAAAPAPVVAAPVLAAPTPAPAVAEPTGEVLEDDATPQAAAPSDEAGEQIEDDATPMGAFDEPHCWVHWVMMLGILLTALYGIVVVRRRLALTSDIDDIERQITGRTEDTEETFVPLTGHQAL